MSQYSDGHIPFGHLEFAPDNPGPTLGYRLVTATGGSPYMKYFPRDPRTIHEMSIKPGITHTHPEGVYFVPGTCRNEQDCYDLEMTIVWLATENVGYTGDLRLWRVKAWDWEETPETDGLDRWRGGRARKIKYIRQEPQLLKKFTYGVESPYRDVEEEVEPQPTLLERFEAEPELRAIFAGMAKKRDLNSYRE